MLGTEAGALKRALAVALNVTSETLTLAVRTIVFSLPFFVKALPFLAVVLCRAGRRSSSMQAPPPPTRSSTLGPATLRLRSPRPAAKRCLSLSFPLPCHCLSLTFPLPCHCLSLSSSQCLSLTFH